MKLIIYVLLLVMPHVLLAFNFDKCLNKAVSTSEMLSCGNKEYDRLDKQVNQNYKKLQMLLPDQEKLILKIQQQAWLKYRKAYCEAFYKGEGTIVMLNVSGCYVDMTQKRVKELKKQYQQAKELYNLKK